MDWANVVSVGGVHSGIRYHLDCFILNNDRTQFVCRSCLSPCLRVLPIQPTVPNWAPPLAFVPRERVSHVRASPRWCNSFAYMNGKCRVRSSQLCDRAILLPRLLFGENIHSRPPSPAAPFQGLGARFARKTKFSNKFFIPPHCGTCFCVYCLLPSFGKRFRSAVVESSVQLLPIQCRDAWGILSRSRCLSRDRTACIERTDIVSGTRPAPDTFFTTGIGAVKAWDRRITALLRINIVFNFVNRHKAPRPRRVDP